MKKSARPKQFARKSKIQTMITNTDWTPNGRMWMYSSPYILHLKPGQLLAEADGLPMPGAHV